jgi:amino acid adenylation domain-containing protein
MTFINFMNTLNERAVRLQRDGGDLIILGEKDTLTSAFLSKLSAYKAELLDLVDRNNGDWRSSGFIITPEMLPLVELSAEEIEKIVNTAPGGAANVQDIYPLAPLQEGILFHHQISTEGDPYLTQELYGFDSRGRLEAFLKALQAVIDRHDILRTAVQWEGLREPVQVVWRQAPLIVEEISIDQGAGDVARQLAERFNPRSYRIDIRQAPMMRVYIAHDEPNKRWVMACLYHHVAVDHMTMEVLQDEILAHMQGRVDRLPAPLPFRNFVAQARMGVSQEEHESFFREMLGDVDEPTAPYGLIDVHGDGSDVREAWRKIDAAPANRLRLTSRALGVSAASLCHLAWALALRRVLGRDDVVFGTVVFGRMHGGEGADRAPGMMMNTLPIRIRLGAASVEESARQTHQLLAELMRHEHASLALAQKCSAVAAPRPLFSSLLNYRHSPRDVAPAPEMESAWMGIKQLKGEERTNYPLVMSITDLGDGFRLSAQAAAPADPLRVCELMRTALERLAEALERAPETPARAIDALPEAERRQLVEEWNATEADYPAARSRAAGSRQESLIHELFEDQVEKNPHAVAVVYEEQSLTYGDLNLRANRLAWRLRELGVRPEARVAICMERSLEMVVALLATLKAGAAYVPLDPDYPGERLAYMLEESAPAVLLTHEAALAATAGRSPALPMLNLESDEWQWAGQSERNPDRTETGMNARNLAYVIYTSGSTGRPKGVMINHGGLANYLKWVTEAYRLEEGEGAPVSSSIGFDLTVTSLYGPLVNGKSVHLLPEEEGIEALARALSKEREYSLVKITPAHLDLLAEQLRNAEIGGRTRVLVIGGEELKAGGLKFWQERAPGTRLINEYGPTETVVGCCVYEVKEEEVERDAVPIGRPIANTQIYILDEERQPAPMGVGGGIYIGGAQVGRGYDGRPEMTAERFLPDPFSRELGSRMYKTGDVGRWLSEGAIEFLGRNDCQVKIRGYRIELGEIEAKLSSHGGVREAVVVAREEGEVGKMLAAYYTGAEVGAEALRGHLSSSLPEYMVPAAYMHLERLPLTPNGKLDRRALPAPDVKRAEERDGYLGPRTPVEEIVVGIFEEVLKLDRVGRRENFFELGGHSLLATQVVSRIRKMSGVEIGMRSVFEEGTVEGLARKIEEAMRAGEKMKTPPLAPVERESERGRRLPLSFAQQRLWFIDQLEPGNALYNIPGGVRLEGSLNVEALEGAINEVVRRHEVLRTRIEVEEGEPFQVIDEWEPRRLEVENLSGMAVEERAREVEKAVQEEAGKGFDLSRDPLLRVKLLKLEEEEHVALFTMHHIISDAWSMGVLVRELCLFYEARSKGLESPLPELDIQYADYASWQRNYLSGEVLEEHLRYWRKQLGVKPQAVNLAGDHPRPSVPSDRGAVKSLSLPAELYGPLKALSKREGATMFMVLLAAFKTLLHKYTAQDDILVGTSALNRNRMEIEPLIGFFVNMLPMKTNFGGNPRFREILRRVKMVALGAYAHQDLPFEKLVEEIQPERKLGQMPLFNIVFGVFNAPHEEMRLSGLKVSPVTGGDESARLDLSLWITEGAETGRAGWTYSTDLFEEETIVRMHGHFETLLSIIVAQPDVLLDQIEILSEAERIQQSARQIAREEYNYSRFKSVRPRAGALSKD